LASFKKLPRKLPTGVATQPQIVKITTSKQTTLKTERTKMTERCHLLTYKIDYGTGEPILAKEVHRNLSVALQRCRELEDEKGISDVELEVVYVH